MDSTCAITGMTTLHYLAYDDRNTNRVEIDVSYSDLSSTPAMVIGHLLGQGANVEA